MADIFTPWQLGELTIPNRLVRSATWEGMAQPDGTPTFETVNFTAELAEHGVGLIITGYAFIHPLGRGLPHQTGVHIDAMVGPITRISDAVHKNNGLVAMQIVHAGGQTKSEWIGGQPLAPSAMTHLAFKEEVAELSKSQIADIVGMFGRAAARVKAAGFDAIQLHGAHGYLISEFLSPLTNKRGDEYGGSIENRGRFCLEVYQAVRREVGPHYPVFIKLNSEDGLEGGLTPADAAVVAGKLSAAGIDAIEVSGGMAGAGKKSPGRAVTKPEEEGYFFANAKVIKAAVKCPVIVVGGWRSKSLVEKALDIVDAVSMSRPFIRQPNLAELWRAGQSEVAACISCGQCLRAGMKGGVLCAQEHKAKEETKG
jgi:2,4-dienoyl-CoA reductase-like NADH-dependent reductase (Old Yellow Enzyme family)